jgi:hypothetical protein
MKRTYSGLFFSLLFAAGCGSADPVLLLTLTGVPEMTSEINVTVSKEGASDVATFSRNDKNVYVKGAATGMAAMMPSPSTVKFAFELPARAVGQVITKIEVRQPESMTPMSKLKTEVLACEKLIIENGIISARTMALKTTATTCPTN